MPRRSLGSSTLLVLQALASRYRHGFDIMDATGLASGTVYPILNKLEENKLARSAWRTPGSPSARAGRPDGTMRSPPPAPPHWTRRLAGWPRSPGGSRGGARTASRLRPPDDARARAIPRAHLPHRRPAGARGRGHGSVARRAEWRREWEAELWYALTARRTGPLSLGDRLGLVVRCLGAYQHAAWLGARRFRRHRVRAGIGLAVRALRDDPLPGVLTLTTVALAVAMAGILFGVAEQARRRVLPSPEGERIVRLFNSAPAADLDRTGLSGFELARFRAHSRSFEELAAFRQIASPSGLRVARIAPGFLDLLRVRPSSGRAFLPADYRPDARPVALARDDAGMRVGATLIVSGVRHTVVGTILDRTALPPP